MSNADYAPNPEMLRRAAEACRNIQKQATGRVDWFDWVSTYLDYWATQIDGAEIGTWHEQFDGEAGA